MTGSLDETFVNDYPLPESGRSGRLSGAAGQRLRRRAAALPWTAILVGVAGLAFALILRVAWLDSVPTNITADEADNLATIIRIEETGEPGFFGLDWKPQPAMSMYLFRFSMYLFGNDIYGLRMASAILSVLALIPFYLLARRAVAVAPALAATFLLATGRWYLHFSRSGWENVHTSLFALVAALALVVGIERRQIRWFVVAGVASSLGLYGYFSGRMILVALLAYAPLALWWAKGFRAKVVAGYAALVVTCLVLFTPQVPAIAEDWDTFNRRTDKIFVLHADRPYLGETSDAGVIKVQAQRVVEGFFLLEGDVFERERYGPAGQTLFDPMTGLLILAGLLLSLRRWRATALWWVMLLVPLIGTQVLSVRTPDGARAVMVAPFFYLFVALALDGLFKFVRERPRETARLAVVAGVLLIAVVNVQSYASWIRSPRAEEVREPAVELADYDEWQAMIRARARDGKYGARIKQFEEAQRRKEIQSLRKGNDELHLAPNPLE